MRIECKVGRYGQKSDKPVVLYTIDIDIQVYVDTGGNLSYHMDWQIEELNLRGHELIRDVGLRGAVLLGLRRIQRKLNLTSVPTNIISSTVDQLLKDRSYIRTLISQAEILRIIRTSGLNESQRAIFLQSINTKVNVPE